MSTQIAVRDELVEEQKNLFPFVQNVLAAWAR